MINNTEAIRALIVNRINLALAEKADKYRATSTSCKVSKLAADTAREVSKQFGMDRLSAEDFEFCKEQIQVAFSNQLADWIGEVDQIRSRKYVMNCSVANDGTVRETVSYFLSGNRKAKDDAERLLIQTTTSQKIQARIERLDKRGKPEDYAKVYELQKQLEAIQAAHAKLDIELHPITPPKPEETEYDAELAAREAMSPA